MDNKHDWLPLNFWANALEKKYPGTNLISLSDEKLKQMLLSLDEAKGMPELPNEDVYYYALACAWAVVQYGYDDSHDVPDAYI